MSSRKVNSASKRLTPSTTINSSKMNATVMSRRGFNGTLRVQDSINLRTLRVTPSTDWNLEVDFAYNEYIQALMTSELIQMDINLKEGNINDHLSSKADQLAEIQEEADKLEEEIEKFELKPRLQHLTNQLKILTKTATDVLSSDVENSFDEFTSVLQNAQESLYLRNVKLFESENDIVKFTELLADCKRMIEKIIRVAPDAEVCQKQVGVLNEYKNLEDRLIWWDTNVSKQNADSNKLILKVLSNKLTNYICKN